jgi:hypothetical protein
MSDILKVILGVLGGAIAVLLLIGGFSGGGMGGMGSMMSGGMMGGGIFGGLVHAAFLDACHSADRRAGGLDHWPNPAARLTPGN